MAAASATVPAYLADIFGTQFVGAIHGRLLTAWATGRYRRPGRGQLYPRGADRRWRRRRAQSSTTGTMYILAGMLALGLHLPTLLGPAAGGHVVHEG